MTIRVLVCDDQMLLRTGLVTLIDAQPDLEVAGECADGPTAVELARRLRPDVICMDVRMPGGDGLAATVVSRDDLTVVGPDPDVYGHALWELGLPPEHALAVESSAAGLSAATAAKLTTLVVTTPYTAGQDFTGAAAVRHRYDEPQPLRASGCVALHRRWLVANG